MATTKSKPAPDQDVWISRLDAIAFCGNPNPKTFDRWRRALVSSSLNHVSGSFGGSVSAYQRHKFEDHMRRALEAWARDVDGLVRGEPAANVIELAAARA